MKGLRIYILIILLLGGGYLYLQFGQGQQVDWRPTYARTDKIPYGTYVLHEQLDGLLGANQVVSSRKPIYNTLAENDGASANYVLVNQDITMDSVDYAKLAGFVSAGNNAFFAANDLGRTLRDSLGIQTAFNYNIAQRRRYVHFTSPALQPDEHHHLDREIIGYHFSAIDTARAVVLAVNGVGQPVYLRYPLGEGNLYVAASADYFVNFSVLDPEGEAFSAKALSYLSPKPQLIWDDFNALGPASADSPFRFFLNDPYLRPAYLLALLGMLAYILYGIKRRQRIIPVVEPLRNTSIEFAKVVSSVYFQQRDHLDIIRKKTAFFLDHVRTAYRIRTDVPDTTLAELLAERSGVDPELIRRILQKIQDYRETTRQPSDQELLAFNHAIEKFHQNESHGRSKL